jgi:hypothetical protein
MMIAKTVRLVFAVDGDVFFDSSAPMRWELDETQKFTEQEIEDAKTICRIGKTTPHAAIQRYPPNALWLNDVYGRMPIVSSLFPSIKVGEKVKLSEIVGCEERINR